MRIAIIKLGAKGDVIRTLPIVNRIKKKYSAEIIFFTRNNVEDLVKLSNLAETVVCSFENDFGKFDKVYNFDFDDEATYLAESLLSDEKYGFRREDGVLKSYNLGAEYYLNTIFDDDLKKNNLKTYQEMMFELAEIEPDKENYLINLDKTVEFGKQFVETNSLNGKKLIGVHVGASSRWPSKAWHEDKIFEFVKMSKAEGYEIVLFGGPEEKEKQDSLVARLTSEGLKVYRNNLRNSDLEFASVVNACDVLVCSDSFSLHVALALGKPTIGLFFCTSANEVEGYGLLKKILSPRLYEFFPERMDEYDDGLVKSISEEEVISKIKEVLTK